MVKLETLNISNNKISVLPSSLSKLRSLTTLEAGHNEISKYPEGINGLTKVSNYIGPYVEPSYAGLCGVV